MFVDRLGGPVKGHAKDYPFKGFNLNCTSRFCQPSGTILPTSPGTIHWDDEPHGIQYGPSASDRPANRPDSMPEYLRVALDF